MKFSASLVEVCSIRGINDSNQLTAMEIAKLKKDIVWNCYAWKYKIFLPFLSFRINDYTN